MDGALAAQLWLIGLGVLSLWLPAVRNYPIGEWQAATGRCCLALRVPLLRVQVGVLRTPRGLMLGLHLAWGRA